MKQNPHSTVATCALAVMAVLVSASTAWAGAWVRDPGDGYVKVGVANYASPQSESGVTADLSFSSTTYDIYGEFGLPGHLQLVVGAPYRVAMHDEATSDRRYIHRAAGDLRLELDRAILRAGFPLAVGLEGTVPMYQSVADYDAATGIDSRLLPAYAARFPDVGDGIVTLTPKLLLGWSHQRVPMWVSAEVGPRVRLEGLAHSVWASVDLGIFVVPRVLAVGVYTNADVAAVSGSERTRQSLATVQGYAMFKAGNALPGWSLRLAGGGVYWADGASRGRDISAGLAWEF